MSGNVSAARGIGWAGADFRRPGADELESLADTVSREINADEAVARTAAAVGHGATWSWRDDRRGASLHEPFQGDWLGDRCCQLGLYVAQPRTEGAHTHLLGIKGDVPAAAGAHIVRFDPAKVLAECSAKRLLVGALLDSADTATVARVLRLLVASNQPSDAATARPLPEPDWLPYPQRVGTVG